MHFRGFRKLCIRRPLRVLAINHHLEKGGGMPKEYHYETHIEPASTNHGWLDLDHIWTEQGILSKVPYLTR